MSVSFENRGGGKGNSLEGKHLSSGKESRARMSGREEKEEEKKEENE